MWRGVRNEGYLIGGHYKGMLGSCYLGVYMGGGGGVPCFVNPHVAQ